ncbi:coiled-coil domain-containing protein 152 isoform X1 [Bubalus kerabau]|uniref:coiled-coil domain-containing protein 152 isoform X1 n=2 Tax=Bubalus bubalis TaxID=89462 RepID=UPI00042C98F1|nr:coiled-coil domain-containing protein 152 isoform X1 [Bubalus bubalis]XP_055410844.1 coiled-coil domain-containing protein 152 isoform X1 [Bubalus carabanensis]
MGRLWKPRATTDMNQNSEGCMKKISSVNLDKLINDFSQIEKKMIESSGKNNILDMQLEKANCLLRVMQTKEVAMKQECATLHDMIKGLQHTIEYQHNLKGENEQLKRNADLMKEKFKMHEQEHRNNIAKLMSEMKIKEEGHKIEITKLYQDMQKKLISSEEKNKELIEKKELEISELNAKLRTQEREKQNEMIKLQLEFDAKLARVQTKTKSYPDSTVSPHSIYKRKLQHLQQEKDKEIAVLRNTIRDLEQRLSVSKDSQVKLVGKDPHFKRRRF